MESFRGLVLFQVALGAPLFSTPFTVNHIDISRLQDHSNQVPLDESAYLSNFPPASQNRNNSNSCAMPPSPSTAPRVEVDEPSVRSMVIPSGGVEPIKKRNKFVRPNCPIEITLEGKNLWDEFCRRGTEMIVNRSGRYTPLIIVV